MPRWAQAYADVLFSVLGHPRRLCGIFERSSLPMVLVDRERRHVHVNRPARLLFRLCLDELRRLRIDDLTPPHQEPIMLEAWNRLMATESVAGTHQIAAPDGAFLDITYYALANALPGLHLITFAPAEWPDGELLADAGAFGPALAAPLTPRELEVLDLAATGCNGPMIAAELVVSAATVRTHFEHIYEKLEVRDRAAAVAKAMRLGLIA
ncbi:MAG TPA: LuxR C-terminal-related transcriptional regulator [Solirubrobacteraceae bacterium]|jgi:DNA-binding CsgD family transcriptional regulator|nr:LuxR C-terminal-related transcriptional regulator [Solirubrobacteraceae bacterium]